MSRLFVVVDLTHPSGNCGLFWRVNSCGYTCNLAEAGRYSEEEARAIEHGSEKSRAVPLDEVEPLAVRHVRHDDLVRLVKKEDPSRWPPKHPGWERRLGATPREEREEAEEGAWW